MLMMIVFPQDEIWAMRVTLDGALVTGASYGIVETLQLVAHLIIHRISRRNYPLLETAIVLLRTLGL